MLTNKTPICQIEVSCLWSDLSTHLQAVNIFKNGHSWISILGIIFVTSCRCVCSVYMYIWFAGVYSPLDAPSAVDRDAQTPEKEVRRASSVVSINYHKKYHIIIYNNSATTIWWNHKKMQMETTMVVRSAAIMCIFI